MTDISVTSSLTAQTVWAANSANRSATLSSNAPGIAYFRFNGTATTALGGYHFTLVEGGSAEIDAPEVYDSLSVIFDTATALKGVTGQLLTASALAGAGTRDILTILQEDVAPEIGLAVPDGVLSSTDREHIELKRAVNKALKAIRRAHRWQKLIQLATYTGDGSEEDFDLPDDFDWMPDGERVWSSALKTPLNHILSTDDWLGLDVQDTNTGVNSWIIYSGQMHIKAALASGATATHFYQSSAAVQPVTGVAKSFFTLDTDTFRIDDELLALAIIYIWKQDKGLPYAEHLADYEILKEKLIARDKGATILKQGRARWPRGVNMAYPLSVPGGIP